MDRILTETDSPYMGPDKGVRNDPSTVVRGVAAIAEVKRVGVDDARAAIRHNFKTLFGI
jgi:TatD DNase family protein